MSLRLSGGQPQSAVLPWKSWLSVCKPHNCRFLRSFHICWATYRFGYMSTDYHWLLAVFLQTTQYVSLSTLVGSISGAVSWIKWSSAFCICRVRIETRQLHGTTHLVTRWFLLSQGERKKLRFCFSYNVIMLWFTTYKSSECFHPGAVITPETEGSFE